MNLSEHSHVDKELFLAEQNCYENTFVKSKNKINSLKTSTNSFFKFYFFWI